MCSYPPDRLKDIGISDTDIRDMLGYFARDAYEQYTATMRQDRQSVISDYNDDTSVLTDCTYGTKRDSIIRKMSSDFASFCDFSVTGEDMGVSFPTSLVDDDDRSYIEFMVNNPADHLVMVRSPSFPAYSIHTTSSTSHPNGHTTDATPLTRERLHIEDVDYLDFFLLSGIGVEDYANMSIFPDIEPYHIVESGRSGSVKKYTFCRQPDSKRHFDSRNIHNKPSGPHNVHNVRSRLLGKQMVTGRGTGYDNSAFVFIKPHANTGEARDLVRRMLTENGIVVEDEGCISAERIDEERLIDWHYYAIGSKAVMLKPDQLNVPTDKFESAFHVTWDKVLQQNLAYNALDACAYLGVDATGLDKAWTAAKEAGKLVKLGGGFYCGLIDTVPGKDAIYVMNGFYMAMRAKFITPGSSIYYFNVEWRSKDLSFADFRSQVLGSTDPALSPSESIRGTIWRTWEELGLSHCPNTADNGVHASASPFEALSERLNWRKGTAASDAFGRRLLLLGMKESTIMALCQDPVVNGSSVFDALEGSDADECVVRALSIQYTMYGQEKK